MSSNVNLNRTKNSPNDEFYTKYKDIVKELENYTDQFRGKTIYCNCDNCYKSNFVKYFVENFNSLKIKRLISTCYDENGISNLFSFDSKISEAYKLDISSVPESIQDFYEFIKSNCTTLEGSGDFKSKECLQLLHEADIVVSNPPFSRIRDYIPLLEEYGKKFLVIASMNIITHEEIFPLIKNNKMWLGYTSPSSFIMPGGDEKVFGNIFWYTNLDTKIRHEFLELTKYYVEENYEHFDHYPAININKVQDIPINYDGIMGVPITFLQKHNPDQFEIVGCSYKFGLPDEWSINTTARPDVNGSEKYKRLFIKKKNTPGACN